jgi:hypothetical protein
VDHGSKVQRNVEAKGGRLTCVMFSSTCKCKMLNEKRFSIKGKRFQSYGFLFRSFSRGRISVPYMYAIGVLSCTNLAR